MSPGSVSFESPRQTFVKTSPQIVFIVRFTLGLILPNYRLILGDFSTGIEVAALRRQCDMEPQNTLKSFP